MRTGIIKTGAGVVLHKIEEPLEKGWLKTVCTDVAATAHGAPAYRTLDSLLGMIPEVAGKLKAFTESALCKDTAGSSYNHQAWKGGYLDHVVETMNIACWLYETSPRVLPFKLEDALVVMFLHDIEKPFKGEHTWPTKEARRQFRETFIQQNQVGLTEEQQNALRYVEGEYDDYSNTERKMGPLAAFCHCADVMSARLWFNQGKEPTW
jgi:hypothetical protein